MRISTVLWLLGCVNCCWALSQAEEARVKEAAREYIKDHLKAPATAKFSKETICAPLGKPDADESAGLTPTPECVKQKAQKVGDGADSVVYRASVDAQNSFGALIRTKYQLRVYRTKGKLEVLDSFTDVKLLWGACMELNELNKLLGKGPIRDCDAEYPAAAKQ